MIYYFCRSIVWFLALLFYRHKVYGKEHIPKGGAMIASNHSSFLDPPLVGSSFSEHIHFLARQSLFNFKPFGWLLGQLNTHPVNQGKGNLSTLKMTIELLKKGAKVVIFPEGRRSSDGKLHKGQLGVGMIVQRSQCQIIPVYIHGSYDAWSNRKKAPKLIGRTACVIGSPIVYSPKEGDKKEEQAEIVTHIMERIGELQAWYLNGAVGSPP